MPKNKRKFIDKKNSITFRLVHRSQKDPLIVDENAPQHVLVPDEARKDRKEEHKYGIYFDDEYDYMQHLKSSSDDVVVWEPTGRTMAKIRSCAPLRGKVNFPSSVFASEVEEPVGLLNKAAPVSGLCLDLDPDVVAAMDDDFDYNDPDNVLEDNFMELANQKCDGDSDGYKSGDEERDEVGSLGSDPYFDKFETKSKFTNYSLTSSVIRRNEQLTLLDDRFEKMFEGYDEGAIGALDCEEIEGGIDAGDEILQRLADVTFGKGDEDDGELIKERTLRAAEKYQCSEENEDEEEEKEEIVVDEEKWDCESILTTYSNLYNHPAKISQPKGPAKIRISKRSGIPMNVLDEGKLTASALSQLDDGDADARRGPRSIASQISELSIRPKNESPHERRERKHNLKAYRRERRAEKKANANAFKEEKTRQEKVLLNQNSNQRGVRII